MGRQERRRKRLFRKREKLLRQLGDESVEVIEGTALPARDLSPGDAQAAAMLAEERVRLCDRMDAAISNQTSLLPVDIVERIRRLPELSMPELRRLADDLDAAVA